MRVSKILRNKQVFETFIKVPYISSLLTIYCVSRIRSSMQNLDENINNWIKFVYSFSVLGISFKPIQIPYEIKSLINILNRLKPKAVLEIGTANGGTLFLFCRVANPKATIISIDLPEGYSNFMVPLYKSFAKFGQKICLIRSDSHTYSTLNVVKKILRCNSLDFLFIDGDHSYEGVKKDFEIYSSLVRKGGIIAFHDIVPDYYTRYGIRTPSYTGGVPKFWNEIKYNYRYIEIIEDPNQDGYGIGVLYL